MPSYDQIVVAIEKFWGQVVEILLQGGWAMWVLAVIALVMFGFGMHIALRLRRKAYHAVPESVWRRWIDHPRERTGALGEVMEFVTDGRTAADTAKSFEQLRTTEFQPFTRDLLVMKIFVSSAPLVGLLGTVTGMLSTFGALATGSGGDQTMSMITAGISEALVTTETGLVIALPGLFFQGILARRAERMRSFLARLETVCLQTLHHRENKVSQEQIREAARRQIADKLRARVQEERVLVFEASDFDVRQDVVASV